MASGVETDFGTSRLFQKSCNCR